LNKRTLDTKHASTFEAMLAAFRIFVFGASADNCDGATGVVGEL
jgi:hypothetical protein